MTVNREIVSALPTKAFFVDMLTKDVSLPSAIMDLIDNCVDGALRLRGEGSLEGLTVNLTIGSAEFVISDNCGGIPLDTARRYAFRFGRAEGAPSYDNAVGLFGVGMKRAMFKLGRHFEVYSESERDSFMVSVDVDAWQRESDWQFPLDAEENLTTKPKEASGTTIKVRDLHYGVAGQFAMPGFLSRLRSEISAKHQMYLERGLTVQVNRTLLVATSVKFAFLPEFLHPAHEDLNYNGVTVKLFSGIGEAGPRARLDAGWNVFCNGRMVVKADQTELTGWGSLGTSRIPKYHHQFARFRGCAFFNSLQSSELPWNTTKDGLDVEAELYRTVRLRMASHMRPVINFLNNLDKELDEPDEDKRVLTQMLNRARYAPISDLSDSLAREFFFQAPPPRPKAPQTTRITFSRPKSAVEALKRCLNVTTNKAVGEKAFDWYLENECDSK